MITILYILSTLRRSGPVMQLYYLLKYIDFNKYRPVILTFSREPHNTMKKEFEALGISVQCCNLARINGIVGLPPRVRSFSKKIKPDVIHSQCFRSDWLSSYFLSSCPRVATAHNYPWEDYPPRVGKIGGAFASVLHLHFFRKLPCVVSVSKNVSDCLKQHSINAITIDNCVDNHKYCQTGKSEKGLLTAKLNLPINKRIVLSVGSLNIRKNPLTVVESFLKSQQKEDAFLVMIGDGPLKEECVSAAKSYKNVRFTGFVENVVEYLQCADVFVSASKSEGLPVGVLEALSCGLPVILSDISPHKNILSHNSLSGRLFSLADERTLVSAFNQIDKLAKPEAAIAARQVVDRHYSANRMSKEYSILYDGIVNNQN
jgi:glycosyltransferase involved in cell wall biosynthesis